MSRRWRNPLVLRRRRIEVVQVPVVASAPQWPAPITGANLRTQVRRRRTTFASVPLFIDRPISVVAKRRVGVRSRRGHTFDAPISTQVAVTAPAFVADVVSRAPVRPPMRIRRTTAGLVLRPPTFVPDALQRFVRPSVSRRGRLLLPPWPQQQPATPPTFVPDPVQRPVRVLVVRRGRFGLPPWPQQQPATPPTFVPPMIRHARPPITNRRRVRPTHVLPVVAQSTVSLVPRFTRRSVRVLVVRHGKFINALSSVVVVTDPDFICQDFSTVATVDAYSASVSVDSYGATKTIDAYGATFTVDAYGATATNCGR